MMWSCCLCGAWQKINPRTGQPEPHPPRLVIAVWNCQARLSICDGVEITSVNPQPPEDLLEDALERAGGAINISGYYPVSPALERWARRHL